MHRIDTPTADSGAFTAGNPGLGVPATKFSADWCNAVQEEICEVIEGAGIALSKPSNVQLLAAIQALAALAMPAGAVQGFALAAAPAGWLKCNGAAVSRATYARLFTAIGTTFGVGNGSTTFNVPELRAEFLRGLDDGRGIDVARALGSAQAQQVLAHQHATSSGGNSAGPFGAGATGSQPGMTLDNDNVWDRTNDGTDYDGVVNAAGVIGAENRPRNVALLFCIKA